MTALVSTMGLRGLWPLPRLPSARATFAAAWCRMACSRGLIRFCVQHIFGCSCDNPEPDSCKHRKGSLVSPKSGIQDPKML